MAPCPVVSLSSSDGVTEEVILSSFLGPCPQKGPFSKHNRTRVLRDWFKNQIIFQGLVMFDSSFLTLASSHGFLSHFPLVNADPLWYPYW